MKVLAVLLALFLGVAVVVDRVGVGIAEERVAQEIAERAGLAGRPEVDIAGFPFLTQAVSGRYSDVRVDLTADQLGRPAGTRADVSLRGVRLPLLDAVSGAVGEVPVEQVDGTATLSYDLLAAEVGGDTILIPEADGLRITRTVEALGLEVPVTATGALSLDGQELVIDVTDAEAAGADVPGFVLDRAEDLLDVRYAVPALPFGLQLTGAQAEADGVHLEVAATDTVLRG